MTLPLFPVSDATQRDTYLRTVFDDWIASRAQSTSKARAERALSEESAMVYQEMWHAFAAYCATRNLDLMGLDEDDLQTFLVIRGTGPTPTRPRLATKGGDLSARYAWRMLTLIDRVMRFYAHREGVVPNTAARCHQRI
jgi:hypothetical protein